MKFPRVLVLYPNARGVAFAYFTAPRSLADWGVKEVRGAAKHADSMRVMKQLVDSYRPDMIVMEAMQECGSRRHPRMRKLSGAIALYAAHEGIDVVPYSRIAIQAAFGAVGASTKHEINNAVVRILSVLAARQPEKRKPWQSESHAQGLFDAAALGLTYFADIGRLDIAQAADGDDEAPLAVRCVRTPYLISSALPTLQLCTAE